MKLTTEEFTFCKKYIDLIVKIARTASAASIPDDYREGLIAIGKKYGFINCSVCNSALYMGTCRLFHMYEADVLEYKKNESEVSNTQSDDIKSENSIDNKETEKEDPKRKRNSTKK